MSGFVIKVSDLLQNVGHNDTVSFDGCASKRIANLTKEGISGEVDLQAINETTILATLRNVTANINDISDMSATPYVRHIEIEEYSARFVAEKEKKEDTSDDDTFLLDLRNDTIDIEEMIMQSILLQEPITKMTPEEAKQQETTSDDTEEETIAYESTSLGGNISFG